MLRHLYRRRFPNIGSFLPGFRAHEATGSPSDFRFVYFQPETKSPAGGQSSSSRYISDPPFKGSKIVNKKSTRAFYLQNYIK